MLYTIVHRIKVCEACVPLDGELCYALVDVGGGRGCGGGRRGGRPEAGVAVAGGGRRRPGGGQQGRVAGTAAARRSVSRFSAIANNHAILKLNLGIMNYIVIFTFTLNSICIICVHLSLI